MLSGPILKKEWAERKDVITENPWCCDFTGKPQQSDGVERPLMAILVKTGYSRIFTHFSAELQKVKCHSLT